MVKPLKSAMKKSSRPAASASATASSSAGPSKGAAASTSGPTSGQGKGRAKHSVKLASKPTRFKGSDLESESEGNASGFEDDGLDEEGDDFAGADVEMKDDERDTDDEIERSKEKGVKATKRKRPATTASVFGETLTSLLADPMTQKSKSKKAKLATGSNAVLEEGKAAPVVQAHASGQAPILALSAHKPPARAAVSLEAKARKALKAEKEEKQDRARVMDVVEGWANGDGVVGGQEFERGLRKTAQRGVIKLFNAILQASKNAEAATGGLSAQAGLKPDVGKKKEKDNILGRGGKEDVLTKESFLDMVRKGSTR
ncbi:hypothetical protein IAU60_004346 [Kwoniella sp. DSM 27419]